MIAAARQTGGRVAEREALLIMIAYRHGLRASELAGLRWDQIDLKAGAFHVVRRKNGSPSTHPLRGPELRALRSWKRLQDEMAPYVFTSLRGGPMTIRTVHFVVAAAARRPASNSRFIRTRSGTRPASSWRTPARTCNLSSSTWGTRTFSTRRGIPS